ncbi:hypothetical protein [Chromobacterium phragmitis]|uniref:ESPR domain-containing protein n=1 Tax=Chromobacterium phragmitis TaxID=2202141 RepID=A0ABV0IT42_9NEIS|nr:hypothetical protein [Chromobacterium phragmitis]
MSISSVERAELPFNWLIYLLELNENIKPLCLIPALPLSQNLPALGTESCSRIRLAPALAATARRKAGTAMLAEPGAGIVALAASGACDRRRGRRISAFPPARPVVAACMAIMTPPKPFAEMTHLASPASSGMVIEIPVAATGSSACRGYCASDFPNPLQSTDMPFEMATIPLQK